jgi:hypothetical protein
MINSIPDPSRRNEMLMFCLNAFSTFEHEKARRHYMTNIQTSPSPIQTTTENNTVEEEKSEEQKEEKQDDLEVADEISVSVASLVLDDGEDSTSSIDITSPSFSDRAKTSIEQSFMEMLKSDKREEKEDSEIVCYDSVPDESSTLLTEQEAETIISEDNSHEEKDDVSSTNEEKEEKTFSSLFLNPSKYGTNGVSPSTIDDIMNELIDEGKTPCVKFIMSNKSDKEIQDYMRAFPIHEFSTRIVNDRAFPHTRKIISIFYKKLESPEQMDQRISEALKTREYFDVISTLCYDEFIKHITPVNSKPRKFAVFLKEIDERLNSFRFIHWRQPETPIPKKTELRDMFAKSLIATKGVKVVVLKNISRMFIEMNTTIHGYKFMKCKVQPDDESLANISVFERDKV